jgi:L-asparaginase
MNRILIIYTGGTIGMVHDHKGKLVPFDFDNIKNNVPELNRLNYHIDVISFNPLIDSSNMSPSDWKKIALLIGRSYAKYDGFVILHGSDTMAYTASALAYMFENLSKPIVLTGSQLPIGEIRTDAKENLITALEIAASKNNDGTATVPEVCIYFDYQLFRGCRATKTHADKFDAFKSPNYPILAEAGVHLKFNVDHILNHKYSELKIHTEFAGTIAVLKLFPGITKLYVESVLNTPNLDAVLIEGFGVGNTSTETWFVDLLKIASEKEIILFDITQCGGGTVEIGRYETSTHLSEIGVISGRDLTFEAAITKLMFLFGNYDDKQSINQKLIENLRGEININEHYESINS